MMEALTSCSQLILVVVAWPMMEAPTSRSRLILVVVGWWVAGGADELLAGDAQNGESADGDSADELLARHACCGRIDA